MPSGGTDRGRSWQHTEHGTMQYIVGKAMGDTKRACLVGVWELLQWIIARYEEGLDL